MATDDPKKHPPDCECCKNGKDAFLKGIEEKVRKNGYTMIATMYKFGDGSTSPMTYTVGLSNNNLPELIVFGVRPHDGQLILSNALELMRQAKLKCSVPQPDILRDPVYVLPVTPLSTEAVLNVANLHAGRQVDALQIVMSDGQGRFPWDPDCDDNLVSLTPLLFAPPGTSYVPKPLNPAGDDPLEALIAASAADLNRIAPEDDSIAVSIARKRPG